MNCFQAKAGQIAPQWYVIDANEVVVGRLAAQIAPILMGKHRPTYTPHIDTGDYVIVTNVDKVVFTGNKWQQKFYQRYSGHPGGQKDEAAWKRVDPSKPHPTPALARQAREVAQLAVQLTQQKDGLILDTLAAAQFACGDLESALATQRKAVKLLPDNKDLAASLARYEKLWAEPSKGQKGPCLV